MFVMISEPTLFSTFDDISARVLAPAGSTVEIVAPVYSGSVLLVEWEGKRWYVQNNGIAPHLDTRPPPKQEAEVVKKSPWDAPWKRRRKAQE